jgi:Bacterial archaeo-eukaryotic release factor family 10
MITAEMVDRITRFDGRGLPVVSAYVPLSLDPKERGAAATHASSLAHEIRPLTEDESLSRDARLSLRDDIQRLEGVTADERLPAGTLTVFSCSGAGFFEELVLPRTLRDRIVVDATPWVRPLMAVLDEFHRCCLVILDKTTAQVWDYFQGELQPERRVVDARLRKPNYAGWHGLEEHRVRYRANEQAKRHFRRVAELVDDLFRADSYDLIAVGGHQEDVPRFLDHLPRALRHRVAGTFAIDPRTADTGVLKEHAQGIVEAYERAQEQHSVAEVLDRGAAGGLGAVGVDLCLWAGSVSAVQALLVHGDAAVPGVVCESCGWLGTQGQTCAMCGLPTRPAADVLDELAEAVIDDGGSVEHVVTETALKEHLVAASLRFPLPPVPDAPG